MYLSRVEIDTRNRQKLRDLTHLGAYHGWIEDSFPEEQNQQVRTRKLWRIDRLQNKEFLLLISNQPPDLQRLEKYGVEGSAETKEYDTFLNSLHNGTVAKFRATLNPVISKFDIEHPERRGRVVSCVSVESQMKYFFDRTEKNGFRVFENGVTIVHRSYEILKKKGHKNTKLSKVTYEGTLEIIDIEKFKAVLTHGLGRKKAYGFGMITIIPVK